MLTYDHIQALHKLHLKAEHQGEENQFGPIEKAVNAAADYHKVTTTGQYDMAGFALEHLTEIGAEYLDDDIDVIGLTVHDLFRFLGERFGPYWYTVAASRAARAVTPQEMVAAQNEERHAVGLVPIVFTGGTIKAESDTPAILQATREVFPKSSYPPGQT